MRNLISTPPSPHSLSPSRPTLLTRHGAPRSTTIIHLVPGWLLWPALLQNDTTFTEEHKLKQQHQDKRRKATHKGVQTAKYLPRLHLPLLSKDLHDNKILPASNAVPFWMNVLSSGDDDEDDDNVNQQGQSNSPSSSLIATLTTVKLTTAATSTATTTTTTTNTNTTSTSMNKPTPSHFPKATEVRYLLPWLCVSEGQPNKSDIEYIAGSLALKTLQICNFTKYNNKNKNGRKYSKYLLPKAVAWVGDSTFPSAPIAAAASLVRMAFRCHKAGIRLGENIRQTEGNAVLFFYHPEDRELAGQSLALFLHLHGNLSPKEAIAAATTVTRATIEENSLTRAIQGINAAVDGFLKKEIINWPYAGGQVEAVGDAVGGWELHVPLIFSVKEKKWLLEVWGLQPGVHSYKFQVDGRWMVDVAQPTIIDSFGNQNNVIIQGDEMVERMEMALDVSDGMAAGPGTLGNDDGSSSSSEGEFEFDYGEEGWVGAGWGRGGEKSEADVERDALAKAKFGLSLLSFKAKRV